MRETRLQKKLDAITEPELLSLRKIYKSLVDGISKPSDWFEPHEPKATPMTKEEEDLDAEAATAGL